MPRPHAISFVQLDTFWVLTACLAMAVAFVALRSIGERLGGSRRLLSWAGIVLQAVSFALAGVGFTAPTLPWWAPYSIVSTLLVLALGGAAITLFLSAAVTMGRNWSLVARTGPEHQLIRSGPFAMVRHPIYLAFLLYLISIAAALAHWQQLIFAVPVYLLGTAVRIRDEEKLLRTQFGEEHARYVRTVPALIPLIV